MPIGPIRRGDDLALTGRGQPGHTTSGDKLEVQIVAVRGASLAHQDDAVDERGLERGAFGGVGLIVGGTSEIEDVLDTR